MVEDIGEGFQYPECLDGRDNNGLVIGSGARLDMLHRIAMHLSCSMPNPVDELGAPITRVSSNSGNRVSGASSQLVRR